MNIFTAAEVAEIKEKIAQGQSSIKIADQYVHPGRSAMDCIIAVAELADYSMECDSWMYGSEIQTSDRLIKVAYAHPCPRVMLLDNVLSVDECNAIVDMSLPHLKPSTVQESSPSISMARNSKTAYLNRGSSELIARIDKRCSEIMHSPVEFGESLQVVRYSVGGQYMPHYDYFRAPKQGELKHVNGGNRTATLLMFLNDVPHGGKTYFPGLGLAVRPSRGSAIYFKYMNSKGQLDPSTLHGGEKVDFGVKWIMTKWSREGKHTVD